MNKEMSQEEFYRECGRLLGVETQYKDATPKPRWSHSAQAIVKLPTKATRWSGREPGNGRFPGCGVIRIFSASCIHVALKHPVQVNRSFPSYEAVLLLLEEETKKVPETA